MTTNEGNNGGSNTTRIILFLLLFLLIVACSMMGYFAYKLYSPQAIPAPMDTLRTDTVKAQPPVAVPDTLQTEVKVDKDSLPGDNSSMDLKMRGEIFKQELSSYYPQMEGAEYLIIGTADTVVVAPGVSLTKLAKTYFGSGDFVSYIKFYNRIDNPDMLRAGQKLLIPLLTKK
jgi:outer membrane lipopolysaccharide assembly protein LptE/RlpB